MIVAIVGSRSCGALSVEQIMREIPIDCTGIVSGGAMGVDTLAREVAVRLHLPLEEIRPDYDAYGRMAPILRNGDIVERADLLLAFWDYHSRGTRDTIRKAMGQGKAVRIVDIRMRGDAKE